MDHQIGQIDLITWQGRKTRRVRSGPGGLTLALLACALVGLVLMGVQAAGLVHWDGPMAVLPIALMGVAILAPLIAVVRVVLTWIVG